ncbi:MAG: 1-acyl-sn-glycerol-3-phosphate acyltransferase [Acetatifactor sp.]|nr:1-acyl-sn-glycerol-3-phosphate acyltransferase [Acetatifactor sp.]
MIRLILVAIYLVLYLILSLPFWLVLWIMGKKNPERKDRISKAFVGWGFRCIQHLAGTKLIVKGTENIPTDTAVLYVGNHRSFFDVVLSLSYFPSTTGYVSKIETKKVPILRLWMKNIHCLFLDRQNIKEGLKTILEGVEEVKKGISLCIFPEGTRNKVNDSFLPFHEGSFKIAEKGGVPIVPMTLVNTAAILEDHSPWIKKATVVIEFGKPVDMKTMSREEKKEIAATVKGIIEETYQKNKAEYFPESK